MRDADHALLMAVLLLSLVSALLMLVPADVLAASPVAYGTLVDYR